MASSNELRQKLERKVCAQPARWNACDKKYKVIVSNRNFLLIGELSSEWQCFALEQAKGIKGNYTKLTSIEGKFCKCLWGL